VPERIPGRQNLVRGWALAGNEQKTITVGPEAASQRLDKYLTDHPDLTLTRSQLQKLIEQGLVLVDGNPAVKSLRLQGGETIRITIPPPEVPDMSPEDIPLDIVYDDPFLAVINKQPGLVVHPARGNPSHTLVNAILYKFGSVAGESGSFRPGIVHRLDKDTSGLIIIAKDDTTALKLREMVAARQISRFYLGLVCGHMPEKSGLIDLPIGRSRKDPTRMTVTDRKSREARTEYVVSERFRTYDLLEIRLHTGRTHQIRVHLSHLGHPVFGDAEYGGRQSWHKGATAAARKSGLNLLETVDRQMLHASKLEFTHPRIGKELTLTADPPDDMAGLLDRLRGRPT
jgi:23S rRNA pseudouridine1911/1915/1917 synthase